MLSLADSQGWDDPANWGTLRMGDVDGDGRADLCGRSNDGISCWKSDGSGLVTKIDGPGWSDDHGWGGFDHHSTIRLADIDADGKDDVCARAAKGIVCHKSTGTGFGAEVEGPAWSDAAGFTQSKHYGTLRAGDVDGDGRADLCIRSTEGMECWLSDGNSFPTRVDGPGWSDASGWGHYRYWSTIRLADVNGDGRADLCARDSMGLKCHMSSGSSFGDAVEVAALSDESGWNDPSNFLSLRTGDVNNDGAQDLCIRANAGIHCYLFDGDGFASIEGPDWSDTDGWNEPQYFHTIQMGDLNGDGMADLCARHADGWRCHPSTGDGFGGAVTLDEFTDGGGWGDAKYHGTVLFGGPGCVPSQEICNDLDDDCDGEVDEGDVCSSSPGVGTGGAGGSLGAEAGSGGVIPGASADDPGSWANSDSESGDGCACRMAQSGARHRGSVFVVCLGLAFALMRRRTAR